MTVIHTTGLIVSVLRDDRLDVLMVNSASRVRAIPFHLQTLFTRRGDVVGATCAPLPSIAGRWLRDVVNDAGHCGWDLTGRRVEMSGVGSPVAPKPLTRAGADAYPTGDPLDWSSLCWVASTKSVLPGVQLRAGVEILSRDTAAIASFRGGELKGGAPFDQHGASHLYSYTVGNKSHSQAFTDCLDVVVDGGIDLRLYEADGSLAGIVSLRADAEVWLVNEMTSANRELFAKCAKAERTATTEGENDDDTYCDMEALAEVFVGKDCEDVFLKVRQGRRFVGPEVFDISSCFQLLHDVRSR